MEVRLPQEFVSYKCNWQRRIIQTITPRVPPEEAWSSLCYFHVFFLSFYTCNKLFIRLLTGFLILYKRNNLFILNITLGSVSLSFKERCQNYRF